MQAAQLKVDDDKAPGAITVFWCVPVPGARRTDWHETRFEVSSLSVEVRRLAQDIRLTITASSWAHIRNWAGAAGGGPQRRPKVFISYRNTHAQEAEAIAERLARTGIEPWFDKWNMLAGDSVPGKIEEAFRTTEACALLWSSDHPQGKWCTEEMWTAVNKRVNSGYRVIPVRLDSSRLPDLLAGLRYVDLSDWSRFEEGVSDIAQAVLGLMLSPHSNGGVRPEARDGRH